MSEPSPDVPQAAPAPEAEPPPAPRSWLRTIVLLVVGLFLLSLVAIAALTTAGTRVDRLLQQVGDTLEPMPVEMAPRHGPERETDSSQEDWTEPETGTGATGHGSR